MLETIKKLTALKDIVIPIFSISYAIGFVVWSIYSYKMNIGLLPAFDIQYFVSGIIPTFVLITVIMYFTKIQTICKSKGVIYLIAIKKIFIKLITLSVIAAIVFVPIDAKWFKFYYTKYLITNWYLAIGSAICIVYFTFLIIAAECVVKENRIIRPSRKLPYRIRCAIVKVRIMAKKALWFYDKGRAYLYSIVLIALQLYICFNMYTKIPQEFGGVKAKMANLWVDQTKISPNLFNNLCDDAGCYENGIKINVLYYNDKVLIVSPSTKSGVYELTRNYIQAIEWIEK